MFSISMSSGCNLEKQAVKVLVSVCIAITPSLKDDRRARHHRPIIGVGRRRERPEWRSLKLYNQYALQYE